MNSPIPRQDGSVEQRFQAIISKLIYRNFMTARYMQASSRNISLEERQRGPPALNLTL